MYISLYDGLVKILKRKTVFDGRMFKVENITEQHQKFDGTMSPEFTWSVCRRKPSVAVLIHCVPTNEILLVEQFRLATYSEKGLIDKVPYDKSGRTLELVAGGLGEDAPEECARRESMEEAGVPLGQLIQMSGFFPSPGGSDEYIILFYAPVFSKVLVAGAGGGLVDENEDTKVHWMSYARALDMCFSGEIIDGKTIIGILMGRFYRYQSY
ncbi:MAG TPA: NUDIX hydrolase [Spirochaetia bacterium]|nr:NUDIX hydrolase [Spirochaetia bacterium]